MPPSSTAADKVESGSAALVVHVAPPPPIAKGPFSPRQERILDGLEAIFVEEGFRHLRVGALAARLRCSRRTLYGLADTKDELVLTVIDRLLRRMGLRAHECARQIHDPVERVQGFMAAAITEIQTLGVAFAEDIERNAPTRRLFDAHYEYACGVLGRMIQDGIDRGVLRDIHAVLVAEMFAASVARMQNARVLRTLGMTEAEAFTELTSVILHGITDAAGLSHGSSGTAGRGRGQRP